jgi:hypothetical protein
VVGRRPARLSRTLAGLGPFESDLRADPGATGAPGTPAGVGHRSPGRHLDAAGPIERRRDARTPGSRCMPSRRSGCSSRPAG